MAMDRKGNLYVANTHECGGKTIVVYAPNSTTPSRVITKGVSGPNALAFDSAGNLYVANILHPAVTVYAPGSTVPARTIKAPYPWDLTLDAADNLYVANSAVCGCLQAYRKGRSTVWYTISGLSPLAVAIGDP